MIHETSPNTKILVVGQSGRHDTLENVSPDFHHLNVKGQAAEAELIWPVVEEQLGL